MSKFKIGDSVKVVREFQGTPCWVLKMDKTLGMIGKVSMVRSTTQPGYDNGFDGCSVNFPDGNRWWYADSALELVEDAPALVPVMAPIKEFFSGFL